MPRNFSKSKLIAFRQCERRLWLEIHNPELKEDSAGTAASFQVGYAVGDIAQKIYDPKGKGALIDINKEGFADAFERSKALLQGDAPIFECGVVSGGALAFADVMIPRKRAGARVWKVVEVKSSGSVKDYHRDDVAVQAHVMQSAGVPIGSISVATVDTSWVYRGGENYEGLLKETDLTKEALARGTEVKGWIKGATKVANSKSEPSITTGSHCSSPYPCGFTAHCQGQEPKVKYPAAWLPRVRTNALKEFLSDSRVRDMRHVPDDLLNAHQLRVKTHTVAASVYFDKAGAKKALAADSRPAYFLDFETVKFVVPIWKGTRPYQQIPFQFSVHKLDKAGKLSNTGFLDLTGNDPSRAVAEALVAACGVRGPIYAYHASFEKGRIQELAARFANLRTALKAIEGRVVDLEPVATDHYYHPSQEGSWSIKAVLPAIAADLSYESLTGVQHGGDAVAVYLEAINSSTSVARKAEIEAQLIAYCSLDTLAMVRLLSVFQGTAPLVA